MKIFAAKLAVVSAIAVSALFFGMASSIAQVKPQSVGQPAPAAPFNPNTTKPVATTTLPAATALTPAPAAPNGEPDGVGKGPRTATNLPKCIDGGRVLCVLDGLYDAGESCECSGGESGRVSYE